MCTDIKGILPQLATSFYLLQNWQYNAMNAVFQSVFPGLSSPACFSEKISLDDIQGHILHFILKSTIFLHRRETAWNPSTTMAKNLFKKK